MLLSAVLLGSVVCRAPCCAVSAAGVSVWARVLAAKVVDRLCRSWNGCPGVDWWTLCVVGCICADGVVVVSTEWWTDRWVDLWCRLVVNSVLLAVSVFTGLPCGRSVVCIVLTHGRVDVYSCSVDRCTWWAFSRADCTVSVSHDSTCAMSKQREACRSSITSAADRLTDKRTVPSIGKCTELAFTCWVYYMYDDPPVAVAEFGWGA